MRIRIYNMEIIQRNVYTSSVASYGSEADAVSASASPPSHVSLTEVLADFDTFNIFIGHLMTEFSIEV